jgi:hypothetical protein
MSSSSAAFLHSSMSKGRRTAWLRALATVALLSTPTGRIQSVSAIGSAPLYFMRGAHKRVGPSPADLMPGRIGVPERTILASWVTWTAPWAVEADGPGWAEVAGLLGPAELSTLALLLRAGVDWTGTVSEVPLRLRVGSRFLRFIPAMSGVSSSSTFRISTGGKARLAGLARVAWMSFTNLQAKKDFV